MHIVIALLPFAGLLILGLVNTGLNQRASARAKWAARSLQYRIARKILLLRTAAAIQAGLIALWFALWQAGISSTGGLITGTIVSGTYLISDLYLLRQALAARRAYDALGPLAYLAEVQQAFGGKS